MEQTNVSAFIRHFVTARLKDGADGEARQGVCTGVIGETLVVLGESGKVYECTLPANVVPLSGMWGSTRQFAISQDVQG